MVTLTNPSQEEVRRFLTQGEDNLSTGMYNDDSSGHYPTHGLGINFSGKTRAFIEAYIQALNLDPTDEVDHYIYNGTSWVIDETAGKKSLIDEIIWLSSSSNSAHYPFDENSGIPMNDPIRMATSPQTNEQAFDEVVYDAYLNGKYGITGVISNVGSEIWNKLDKNERLALYSLNYNASTLIGSNLKLALASYVNGSSDENKMLGKLRAWYEILYASNGGGDRKGVQNRRFMEANAFLGVIHDKIPEGDDPQKGEGHNNSIIHVNNFAEANVTIAFMNKFSEQMISYMGNISEYKKRNYEIVQNNFSDAISTFLLNQNYTQSYDIDTLFTEWNLYTDLQINTSTGTTSYGDVTGSDKRDLIFITGEQDGTTVHADAGDDFVNGGNYNDTIYGGDGENNLYGNGGDDYIYGGKDKDIIEGGEGNDHIFGSDGLNELNGGNGDDYIYGGKDKDIINGNDGNDHIVGGDGNDELYGDAGSDHIYGGNDDDEIYGGTGRDYLSPGSGTNIIDCGTDNITDFVFINNTSTGVDTIINISGRDYISCAGGFNLSSLEQVGNDVIIYGNKGNKIIIKNVKLPEDDEPENPGTIPFDNMPILYQPDGTILQWDGNGYIDSGTDFPPYDEEPENPEDLPDIPQPEPGTEGIPQIPPVIPEAPVEPEDGSTKTQNNNPPEIPDEIKNEIEKLWGEAENSRSPLVVDLNGDGIIETTSTDSGIYFDFDNNQKIENSGWIGKNEGFLVRDINGNGQIDNGTELFGNHTLLENGKNAVNGFEALADLDSNNNGKFDSGDEAWNEVKVWQDHNTNSIVDEGELLTLEQANVYKANITNQNSNLFFYR